MVLAASAGALHLDFEDRAGGVELCDLGDHGKHDRQLAPGGGQDQGAQLLAQDRGPV